MTTEVSAPPREVLRDVSDESRNKATEFKNQGNDFFKQKDFDKAIEYYTKAIEADPTNAILYSNRAQAYIKTEAYGLAIADTDESLKLDPQNTKSYYRRAVAYTATRKYEPALKDWKAAMRRSSDPKLKASYDQCSSLRRAQLFSAAIDIPDEEFTTALSLGLENMTIDDSYDGVHLGDEMTQEFIDDMIERFKNGKTISRKYLFQIVLKVRDLVHEEPTMVEVDIPEDVTMTVCGDTHGQFFDLINLFTLNGFPADKHWYLFNGDFVDRGSWSTEVALLLYAYKLLRPNGFFLNRGNHEADDMNKMYGFQGECKAKYTSDKVFTVFSESFSSLPLATLIGHKFFVLHGGLFSDDKVTLDHVRRYDRHRQRQPGQAGIMMEMLWTDPQKEDGRTPNKRGVGIQFGPDVTKRFCETNKIEAIIRSHEVRMGGYEVEHDGRCITVFSAPKYCDQTPNKGAYINIKSDYKLDFHTFDAAPHPPIQPMAYANPALTSFLGR